MTATSKLPKIFPWQKPFRGRQINKNHPLSRDLFAAWLFNDGNGSRVTNSVQPGKDGDLINVNPIMGWVSGQAGGALDLLGDDEYVSIPNMSPMGTTSITIVAKVLFRSLTNTTYHWSAGNNPGGVIVNQRSSASWKSGTLCVTDEDSGGKCLSFALDTNSVGKGVKGTTVIQLNTWYHMAGTFKYTGSGSWLGEWNVYVDGKLDSPSSNNFSVAGSVSMPFNGTAWQIGYHPQWPDPEPPEDGMNGLIDHVFIWRRALSENEIAWLYREPYAIYNNSKLFSLAILKPATSQRQTLFPWQKPYRGTVLDKTHPLARGLIGGYLLNEMGGNILRDFVGNNHGDKDPDSVWSKGGLATTTLNQFTQLPNLLTPIHITLEAIIRSDGSRSHEGVISCYQASSAAGWHLGTQFGQWSSWMRLTSGSTVEDDGGGEIINPLAHGYSTYDGSRMQIYNEGVPTTYEDLVGTLNAPTNTPRIGCSYVGTGYWFDGIIYLIRIWDRALSQDEINWLQKEPYDMFRRPKLRSTKTITSLGFLKPFPWQKPKRGRQLNTSHPLARGLVGSYLFNEGTGNVLSDSTPYKRDGIIDLSISWIVGRRGHALDFPLATGEHVNFNSVPITGAQDRTVIILMRTTNTTGWGRLVEWGTDSSGAKWGIRLDQTYGEALRTEHGGGYVTGTKSLSDGLWHVCISVLKGDTLADVLLYVDGISDPVLYSSGLGVSINTTMSNNLMFGNGIVTTQPFDGQIGFVAIWDRALSAAEIKWLAREPYAMFDNKRYHFGMSVSEGDDYTRTLTDTVGITDTLSNILGKIVLLTDTVGITDSVSLILNYVRAITDDVGITDELLKVYTGIRLLTESVGITDAQIISIGRVIALADSVGITDTQIAAIYKLVALADSVGITDGITKVYTGIKVFAEAVGITDTQSKIYTGKRALAESVGITDSISSAIFKLVTIADSVGITDALTKAYAGIRIIADALGITDTQSKVYTGKRSLTESVGITDSLSIAIGKVILISEAVGLSDSMTGILIKIVTLADSVGITDALTKTYTGIRVLTNALGITDTVAKVYAGKRSLTESVGVTDALTAVKGFLRTITDTLGITDIVSNSMIVVVSRKLISKLANFFSQTTKTANLFSETNKDANTTSQKEEDGIL